jgi:hypothetical protein
MARPKANLVVLDPGSGKARPGAWVTIYFANTLNKPVLYADDDVSEIANPVQANGLGQVAVRLNPGLYDVSMTWDGAIPTIVEDVLAWTPETASLTSPGDLIIGDAEGNPQRLAVGVNGQVLLVESGLPKWVTLSSGHGLPAGSNGSLLSYGPAGAVLPILPGLQDQALAIMGGVPTWVSTLLPPGTTLPINQPGDLVVGAETTGQPARLARGMADDILSVSPTGALYWSSSGKVSRGRADCRLQLIGTDLVLAPYKGTEIWIDGLSRTLPAAGVSLAPTGLTQDTTYYIYATWTGTAIGLEASTTSWTLTNGLAHKTGDVTRTLVGMARPGAGPAWVSSEKRRFVLSYFHPIAQAATSFLSAPRFISSGAGVEVHPELRSEFLCWGQVATVVSLTGMMISGTAGVTVNSYLSLDGVVTLLGGHAITFAAANTYTNIATTIARTLAEGYHFVTLAAVIANPPGSAGWHGDASGVLACRTHALISGSS